MFRVSCIDGDRWRIVDASDRLVFVGTRRRGEDWLDRQENLRPRPTFLNVHLRWLVDACVRPLARLVSGAPAHV